MYVTKLFGNPLLETDENFGGCPVGPSPNVLRWVAAVGKFRFGVMGDSGVKMGVWGTMRLPIKKTYLIDLLKWAIG